MTNTEPQRDLARRALAVNRANLALGNEVSVLDGAMFVCDRDLPRVYSANYATSVTASSAVEIERLLARAETEFAHCDHRAFHTDFTTPPEFEARLHLDGYEVSNSLVMLLEGDLAGATPTGDVRPMESDAGSDAFLALFALNALDWGERAARLGVSGDASVGVDLARVQLRKSPPVRYWLAYVDGEARGYFNAWEGIDGVGQVENLFVRAEYRHRGLATALVHHCVANARSHGAGPVVIVADASDTPKQMHAAMGFRPIAIKRTYLKVFG